MRRRGGRGRQGEHACMSASDPGALSAGDISCRRRKPVTDSRVALQELPILVVELAPDSVGVDLQVVQFSTVAGTPDALQDHPAGADLSGVAGEVGEEVELFGREVEGTAIEGGLPVDEVEMQGAPGGGGRGG